MLPMLWPEVTADVFSQLLHVLFDDISHVEPFCFSQKGLPDGYVQAIGMNSNIK